MFLDVRPQPLTFRLNGIYISWREAAKFLQYVDVHCGVAVEIRVDLLLGF